MIPMGARAMSDDWIILIPEDPRFLPDGDCIAEAHELLTKIAPDAYEIGNIYSDSIEFFDCGANLERILCPSCNSEISMEG